jgi:hypothetical protein
VRAASLENLYTPGSPVHEQEASGEAARGVSTGERSVVLSSLLPPPAGDRMHSMGSGVARARLLSRGTI